MSPYATDNPKMRAILAEAGVSVIAMASDRAVLRNDDPDSKVDPIAKLIEHLAPTNARYNVSYIDGGGSKVDTHFATKREATAFMELCGMQIIYAWSAAELPIPPAAKRIKA